MSTSKSFGNSKTTTLVSLLQQRAVEQPTQYAYTFLVDGRTKGDRITYYELDRKARAIASWLQARNAKGQRALLLYPQSIDILAVFFGCLYAGVIAIPAPAPEASRLKRTLPRLQAIAKDAESTFVLSNPEIIDLVGNSRYEVAEFKAMQWKASEEISLDLADLWHKPSLSGDQIAYLQYTSGSTSTPKGVMISHANILHHCAYLQKSCGYSAESVTVTWMPYFHDYGLVEGMLEPLYNGTPCYLMSPFAFIRRPFHWLESISRYRATHSQAPNFAYDQCVRRITPEQLSQLDLSHWQAAGNAAEPINPKVLADFAAKFAACGFRSEASCPAYGLAEATLLVTFSPQNESPKVINLDPSALEKDLIVELPDHEQGGRQVSSCGRKVGEMDIAIVNPVSCKRSASDEVGEIWVSDPSIAGGYWQRPQESEATFHAHISNESQARSFLRTGDLGFLHEQQLYVTGRRKDLIIIRGTNHYPQDLEWTVQESDPHLRPENGAAFSIQLDGEERLVIVQEVDRGWQKFVSAEEIFETIRREIFEQHEVQVYAIALIKRGTLAKTSSGKVQRSTCRLEFLEGKLSAVATWQSTLEIPDQNKPDDTDAINPSASLQNPLYGKSSIPATPNVETPDLTSLSPEAARAKTDELIQWLQHYGKERVNSRLIDERRCLPPYIVMDLGNRGLLGLEVPTELGGLGLNTTGTMRIMEQLGAIDQAMALVVFNHNVLGVRPILNFADSALRQELLPILASGRELAAFALSEPGAGSHPLGMETQAIDRGNGVWELNGTKSWSGLAAWAGAINIFTHTVDAQGKPQGISGFTVRQGTPGLRQGTEAMTMGMRGMIQNTFHLEGVKVGRENLLGEIGKGMNAAQDAMMYGRLGIGAFALGGMKRCAQLMLRYSQRRQISTGRLLENPVTLARMSQTQSKIAAVEALIGKLSQLLDQGESLPVEPYIVCKIAGAEFFWQTTDALVQLLGGRGYVEPNLVPQLLRDARVCRIFEGPTETLNMYMGSRLINQPDEIVTFISQILNAPQIAEMLAETAQKIQARCLKEQLSFGDRTAAIRWASALAGEVATYSILLACTEQAAANTGSSHYQVASEWLRLQLAQKEALALSQANAEAYISSATEITQLFSDYAQSIGEVEQTLAGEELALDTFLQPAAKQPDTGVSTQLIPTSPVEQESLSSAAELTASDAAAQVEMNQSVDSIKTWIVQQLVNQWKVSASSIKPGRSFADYGLDSLMAVNLAQELEDWLEFPIEATIVWNFPTIEALSQHLSAELNNHRSEPEASSAPPITTAESVLASEPELEDIAALSTDNVAELLAQEISHP